MSVLVIADHDGVTLRDSTHKCVTAAKAIDASVDILVFGQGVDAIAKAASEIAGVGKVYLAQSAELKAELAESVSALIFSLAGSYSTLAIPASASGKNFAPRVSALLDAPLISDVLEVLSPQSFVRPIYAGNALETVATTAPKNVLTVRTTAFAAAALGGQAPISPLDAPAALSKTRFVSEEKVVSDRPELGSAKIVVSGGRALGSAEEFKAVIDPLADKLGAAVGASRAAVDAGFAPNDYQVGQTGKVVAPALYVAVGISGAIQHLAGMKDSKVIVAINKDPEAPIFSVADYGLVEDYKTAVPALMNALS